MSAATALAATPPKRLPYWAIEELKRQRSDAVVLPDR
jgi:hypothetical protein